MSLKSILQCLDFSDPEGGGIDHLQNATDYLSIDHTSCSAL
jgi:hypothetical protein